MTILQEGISYPPVREAIFEVKHLKLSAYSASLNAFDGRIVPNSAIIPAGPDGSIQIFTSNATDFFIDINGYFARDDGRTGLSYFPVTQCTAADSSDKLYSGAFAPSYSTGGARSITERASPSRPC